MEILRFPLHLESHGDGVTVTFPDMPYGVTSGQTKAEALSNAVDCIEEIIASLMLDKKDIPKASPARGRETVVLSPMFAIKVLLYKVMREKRMTKAELARRLNWKYPQVDRLFDTHHTSHFPQLIAAANALGKHIIIGIE